MGLFDIFDKVGDFLGKNKSWLKPVTRLGSNLLGANQESGNQQNYLDSLRAAEQRNYDEAKAQYDYNNEIGMANAASRNAASASSAAASRATEANRMGAAKKSFKAEKKGLQEIKDLYKPFSDTDARILPGMEAAYNQGLGNLSGASKFFSSPEQFAKINGSMPAYNIKIPLPDYLFGAKK